MYKEETNSSTPYRRQGLPGWHDKVSGALNDKIGKISKEPVSFFRALALGALLTLSWTPCIGPILASVFVQSANSENSVQVFFSILAFSLGFLVIFLVLGFFTEEVLVFLKSKKNITKYTHIISGIIIFAVGIYFLLLGFGAVNNMNSDSSYSNSVSAECCGIVNPEALNKVNEEGRTATMEDLDFVLKDSSGKIRKLTDFKGKNTVLSFSATWCGYCNQEWPEFTKVKDEGDTNVIVVIQPNTPGELGEEGVREYMKEKGYDFDVLYDSDSSVTLFYQVFGYPTTFFFDAEGELVTYIPGYVDKQTLDDILLFCTTKDEKIFEKYSGGNN